MFKSSISQHCFIGNVTDIINSYDNNILESELALISNSLDVKVTNPEDNICIGFDINNIILGVTNFGFDIQIIKDASYLDFNKILTCFNKPVLLGINSNTLLYNKIYENSSRIHYIVIYKVDVEKGVMWISDTFIPTIPKLIYNGEVKISDFKNYLNNDKAEIYVLNKTSDIIRNYNYKEIFDKYIKKRVEKYDEFDIYKLSLLLETNKLNILKENNLKYLAYVIRVGGMIARFYYLEELCKKYCYNFDDIIYKIEKIKKDWDVICNMFIKLSLLCDTNYLNKIIIKINNVVNDEMMIFENINYNIK